MSIEWKEWNGKPGESGLPLDLEPDTPVLVQFKGQDRELVEQHEDPEPAGDWEWHHIGDLGDIVAYAIIDPEED